MAITLIDSFFNFVGEEREDNSMEFAGAINTQEEKKNGEPGAAVALCASCDRCRGRKTKCNGQRPCSNCANKYMKKNKISRYAQKSSLCWFGSF